MSTQGFKWHSIRVLTALLAALCLLSTASHGQSGENGGSSAIQAGASLPPVEQALVPEGVFAIQLAEALKLGPAPDEAKAEDLLSGRGIEPKNGWIAEYPVTPNVLGDIEQSVAMACDQGKLALTKDQALKLVAEVKSKFGLHLGLGSNATVGAAKKAGNATIYSYTDKQGVVHYTDVYDSIPKEYQGNVKIIEKSTPSESFSEPVGGVAEMPGPQYTATPNPGAIDEYYYDQGPPVVTYYLPPDPYYYLYSWVPYPFWYTGYYFPGFFVLNNFHRNLVFNQQPYFVSHHNGAFAYNHPQGGAPVGLGLPGYVAQAPGSARWFATPSAQTGARAIVSLNQNRYGMPSGSLASRMDASRPRPLAGGSRIAGNAPMFPTGQMAAQNNQPRLVPYSGGRNFNQPTFNQRVFVPNPPRVYAPPAMAQGRAFNMPRSFEGGYSGGVRGGESFGEFHGGGISAGHGGSVGGGGRGGHR